jgi:hypothetical protein
MSTHATIAYRLPDGSQWVGVYQHSDGMDMAEVMRSFVARRSAAELRTLIDGTPQGFSAFNATGEREGRDSQPFGAYATGDHDTTERGRGYQHSRNHPYTCILELDGSVTEMGPVAE